MSKLRKRCKGGAVIVGFDLSKSTKKALTTRTRVRGLVYLVQWRTVCIFISRCLLGRPLVLLVGILGIPPLVDFCGAGLVLEARPPTDYLENRDLAH